MTSTYQEVLGGAITLRKPIVLEPRLGVRSISSACECVLRTLPHIFNNWYEEAIHRLLACCPRQIRKNQAEGSRKILFSQRQRLLRLQNIAGFNSPSLQCLTQVRRVPVRDTHCLTWGPASHCKVISGLWRFLSQGHSRLGSEGYGNRRAAMVDIEKAEGPLMASRALWRC